MKKGTKPTPKHLRKLRGSDLRGAPKNPAVAPAGELVPAATLARSTTAMGYWRALIDGAPYGLLRPVDIPLMERYCLALAFAMEATERVFAEGIMVTSPANGAVCQNPCLAIADRQTEIARKAASELGITPSGRGRIESPVMPPPRNPNEANPGPAIGGDDLDRFLDQHPGRSLN